jgi:putative endonuclease
MRAFLMPSAPMQIFVYMLRCSDDQYYVGLTRTGLDERMAEHASGVLKGYTYWRRPVELVWAQEFQRLTDAIRCEQQLKGWRREKKEAVIHGDYEVLIELSRTARTNQP